MTNDYRMNQSLNPYENLNFEPGLDQELAELMGLEDEPEELIGPTIEMTDIDLEKFFDSFEPSCRVIHSDAEDLNTEELTTEELIDFIEDECQRWAREEAADWKGFDDEDEEFCIEPDPADTISWEDIIFSIMEERDTALDNLKLHFHRLEAEAYLELDCTSSDVSWYAGSVLKHLSLMKRAGSILSLLPTEKECRKTLDILMGKEQ